MLGIGDSKFDWGIENSFEPNFFYDNFSRNWKFLLNEFYDHYWELEIPNLIEELEIPSILIWGVEDENYLINPIKLFRPSKSIFMAK